ncbi:MAG: peptide-methionine (S)-S-oxide reductase MsrA [Alphaproteobacteria bacterium]
MADRTETAVFAAGCFWGVEQSFRDIDGVVDTEVGYTGGTTAEPTYEQVCGKRTGHAEAVRVVFDPARISYERLVDAFWDLHDPTQVHRQGLDVGSQYRSAIFVADAGQRAVAEASRAAHQREFHGDIATEIADAGPWWPAEEHHQRYVEKRRRGILRRR